MSGRGESSERVALLHSDQPSIQHMRITGGLRGAAGIYDVGPPLCLDFAYLRGQVSIEQILRGSIQLKGRCPIHRPVRDGSESFSVNLRKNVFRCKNKKCGIGGNVLDLWAEYRGLPIYEAALDMVDTFQLEITPNRGNP